MTPEAGSSDLMMICVVVWPGAPQLCELHAEGRKWHGRGVNPPPAELCAVGWVGGCFCQAAAGAREVGAQGQGPR